MTDREFLARRLVAAFNPSGPDFDHVSEAHRAAAFRMADEVQSFYAERLGACQRQVRGYQGHLHEVEQVAGRFLGYPWFKDDQKNFPGATEEDGVCIGEHVAETIVEEVCARAERAEAQCRVFETRLSYLWKIARDVVMATEQGEDGRWRVDGDAELMLGELYDALETERLLLSLSGGGEPVQKKHELEPAANHPGNPDSSSQSLPGVSAEAARRSGQKLNDYVSRAMKQGVAAAIDASGKLDWDTAPLGETLWGVYGPDCFPTIFACILRDYPGNGKAIWGYSVYRRKSDFRTLGSGKAWAEENNLRLFRTRSEAFAHIATLFPAEEPTP